MDWLLGWPCSLWIDWEEATEEPQSVNSVQPSCLLGVTSEVKKKTAETWVDIKDALELYNGQWKREMKRGKEILCIVWPSDECRRLISGCPWDCILYFWGIVLIWRGKDVVYNILGYLVFAVPIEMPFIAYREPRWGWAAPPDPPRWGGGHPPLNPPFAMRAYQAHKLLAKAHGVGVVVSIDAGGIVVVKIQLWITSKTMQVDWAIHYL